MEQEQGFQMSQSSYAKYSRKQSFIIIIIVYMIAMIGGYFIIRGFQSLGIDLLISSVYGDLISTFFVFIFSLIMQNSSVYDPYWGLYPITFIISWFLDSDLDENPSKNITIFCSAILFCLRHATFFFRFWNGLGHEDFRYKQFKEKMSNKIGYWIFSLLSFHYFPTVEVFLGYIPLFFSLQNTGIQNEGIYYLGISVSIFGILIEAIADEQLASYRKEKSQHTIDVGLWRFSRHPNYVGEVLFWLGLYISVLGVDFQKYWWTGIGFLIIFIMFHGYSIPAMEKRMLANKPSYRIYQQKVNRFCFWFRKENAEESSASGELLDKLGDNDE